MVEKDGDPRAVRHLRPDNMPPIHMGEVFEVEDSDDDLDMKGIRSWLGELRRPFPDNQIEKRAQPTIPSKDWKELPKAKCETCGGWHPTRSTIHLDYIGHAGVTSRLLDVDPLWEWEPVAYDDNGLPQFDRFGGLWIKLTVCGVTRLGYGDAVGKDPSTTAVKEIIGDAIRNAAMRFGVALDLWSKIDRQSNTHSSSDREGNANAAAKQEPAPNQKALDDLAGVCAENGFDQRTMGKRFWDWARENERRSAGLAIHEALSDDILAFGAYLIETSAPDPDAGAEAGTVADQKPDSGTGAVGDKEEPF